MWKKQSEGASEDMRPGRWTVVLGATSIAACLALLSCSTAQIEPAPILPKPRTLPPPVRVTERPADTDGAVFIVMYHRVTEKPGPYDRTPEQFRNDLQSLYDAGFRPVTLSQYVSGSLEIPSGASPVVLTFDDSDPSQFRFLEDGTIDPVSAVGVVQTFAKEHPDFPMKASFFVLQNGPFGDRGPEKVKYLLDQGCDVGSHTLHHQRLDKMTDDEVKAELAGAQDWLRSLGVPNPDLLSLPLGIRPKDRGLLKSFHWSGMQYEHRAALMVGAGPARSPSNPERDLAALPRINAYDGDRGLAHWLRKAKEGRTRLYVQP